MDFKNLQIQRILRETTLTENEAIQLLNEHKDVDYVIKYYIEVIETSEMKEITETNKKIRIIKEKTNYTEEEAREKLKDLNDDYHQVIANYVTIAETNEKIQIVIRQTNYSEKEAREKLKDANNNQQQVIKNYLGITEKKAPIAKTFNQEMYRQMRNFIYIPPNMLPGNIS